MNAGASAEADADERAANVREGIETAMLAGKPLATVAYGLRKVYDGPKVSHVEKYLVKAAQVLALFTLVDQGHARLLRMPRDWDLARERRMDPLRTWRTSPGA